MPVIRLLLRAVRWGALLAAVVVVTILVVRSHDALTGAALSPWHTHLPDEARAAEIDDMDWPAWLAREETLYADIMTEVVAKVPPEAQIAGNRFYQGSPMFWGNHAVNWNRSFVLMPEGPVAGSVVLLHGMTDGPYSLRHIAQAFRARGFVAVGIRMPGHGTVPAGLTRADWSDWMAATRLAVRHARSLAGDAVPLHLIGYSNGGALAMKYALDALDDPALRAPDRIALISPMIGVTRFARFAGIAGWPALLPGFVRAAWLDILPEFNPVKYNSFPVNAARQSHLLTTALQRDLRTRQRDGSLAGLPPVLTFQSVVDFTVSTPALITKLYNRLPANGSELVLFDVNRAAKVGPLLAPAQQTIPARLLPAAPRAYTTTVITNDETETGRELARTTPVGRTETRSTPLQTAYPRTVYSLSHVALPFPMTDGVYGMTPDPADAFGVNLGTLAPKGEFGVLILGLEQFARMTSNPFFGYLSERLLEALPG